MKKILISLLAMAAMATACKGPANGEPQKPNGGEDDPTVVIIIITEPLVITHQIPSMYY